MKLEHLKETRCNHCGSEVCYESNEHTDPCTGKQIEKRKFRCGRTISYLPNFDMVRIDRDCPKSKLYIKMMKKRAGALAILLGNVKELDVDDLFKNEVLSLLTGNLSGYQQNWR